MLFQVTGTLLHSPYLTHCRSCIMQPSWNGHLTPIIEECLDEKSLFSCERNDCPIRALVYRQYRNLHRLVARNRYIKPFRIVQRSKVRVGLTSPLGWRGIFFTVLPVLLIPPVCLTCKPFFSLLKFMRGQQYGMTSV